MPAPASRRSSTWPTSGRTSSSSRAGWPPCVDRRQAVPRCAACATAAFGGPRSGRASAEGVSAWKSWRRCVRWTSSLARAGWVDARRRRRQRRRRARLPARDRRRAVGDLRAAASKRPGHGVLDASSVTTHDRATAVEVEARRCCPRAWKRSAVPTVRRRNVAAAVAKLAMMDDRGRARGWPRPWSWRATSRLVALADGHALYPPCRGPVRGRLQPARGRRAGRRAGRRTSSYTVGDDQASPVTGPVRSAPARYRSCCWPPASLR
jgi:hypothetical protein